MSPQTTSTSRAELVHVLLLSLSIPQTSHRHFSSLARRLGRIFAHAYFHHREAFEQAEAESSLYARFLALTTKFDLVPPEFLVIPSRLSSYDGRGDDRREMDVQPPRLLAAAVDPQGERDRDNLQSQQRLGPAWEHPPQRSPGRSPPGLGPEPGRDSPRRFGRNRTDTMVFSEASGVVEELAKTNGERELQTVEAESSSPISLYQPQDIFATESELLNAPEIPSILDDDGQLPEATPAESEEGPTAKPESSTPLATEEALPSEAESTHIPVEESSAIAHDDTASNVEQVEVPQLDGDYATEDIQIQPADVPSDVDAANQTVAATEATDIEDFEPVDPPKEEPDAVVGDDTQEVVEVPLTSAEGVEGASTDEDVSADPVEQASTDEPTPDVEKAGGEDAKPQDIELPTASRQAEGGDVKEADTSTTVDQEPQVVAEVKVEPA